MPLTGYGQGQFARHLLQLIEQEIKPLLQLFGAPHRRYSRRRGKLFLTATLQKLELCKHVVFTRQPVDDVLK